MKVLFHLASMLLVVLWLRVSVCCEITGVLSLPFSHYLHELESRKILISMYKLSLGVKYFWLCSTDSPCWKCRKHCLFPLFVTFLCNLLPLSSTVPQSTRIIRALSMMLPCSKCTKSTDLCQEFVFQYGRLWIHIEALIWTIGFSLFPLEECRLCHREIPMLRSSRKSIIANGCLLSCTIEKDDKGDLMVSVQAASEAIFHYGNP